MWKESKNAKASCAARLQPLCQHALFIILVALSLLETVTTQNEQQGDRVAFLPGQPRIPPISQFSGYINVDRKSGRSLFYWFFEAQKLPSQKPLLLCGSMEFSFFGAVFHCNYGPGCSSVGYGAASELGPLLVNGNGTGLEFNKFAWNKEANLLFLESRLGVGFSHTNTSSDIDKLDDHFVAEDTYAFLANWFKRFPQYKKHDFYISGESYAGDCPNGQTHNHQGLCATTSYVFLTCKHNLDRRWSMCSDPIFNNYDVAIHSVLPIYSKLVKAGLRIWVYSGDVDGRVPFIGSRYCVEALGLPVRSQWQPWYRNNQVAGRFVEYEGLTMATVRGAGHGVHQDKPAEALVVINSFLSGRQLPTRNY